MKLLLVNHYAERVQWYDDSRTATMMAPLAKHVSLKRKELTTTLATLAPEIERLVDAPLQQLDALKRLWSCQGEVETLTRVLESASVDGARSRPSCSHAALISSRVTGGSAS